MDDIRVFDQSNISLLKIGPESAFEGCEFKGLDFSDYNLKSVSFLDCKFAGCNMANQSMVNTDMRDVVFESCNLIGINWCSLKRFENAKFINSKLNFSTFQALKLKKIEITGCVALDVDFSEADLTSSDFSRTQLGGANFERANLTMADFRSSTDYIFDLRTARIKGARFSYPHVLSLITALGAVIDD